eukprot:TRINITY_DN29883_c0_g1_i1.p1 TRINITY_DN29883_c0_g1~~TRINITY_DN29883_c0_g1_i1.p1  ORF type:complete len:118 (-),score=14.04 TRINITY_DN29883_c0_g1_i1:76-429(-)
MQTGPRTEDTKISYLLLHLHSGWAVDQEFLTEEERCIVSHVDHDWDNTKMKRKEHINCSDTLHRRHSTASKRHLRDNKILYTRDFHMCHLISAIFLMNQVTTKCSSTRPAFRDIPLL